MAAMTIELNKAIIRGCLKAVEKHIRDTIDILPDDGSAYVSGQFSALSGLLWDVRRVIDNLSEEQK